MRITADIQEFVRRPLVKSRRTQLAREVKPIIVISAFGIETPKPEKHAGSAGIELRYIHLLLLGILRIGIFDQIAPVHHTLVLRGGIIDCVLRRPISEIGFLDPGIQRDSTRRLPVDKRRGD